MDDSELDEVVAEFIAESHEDLDRLDQELVALEQRSSPDTLARVFRTIHTIKGTSGFLGFGRLEAITHAGENLLSKLRDGELEVTTEMTTGLLAMLDAVREVLASVESTGAEPDREYDELIARLERLDRGEPATAETGTAHEETVEPPVEATSDGAAEVEDRSPSAESIRVDVGLLDDLMNLVGELVLARNQILQFTQDQLDPVLGATSQRLNLITTELQEGVMKTRMQPIENIWNKFPRVVRDLSVTCGKSARLELEGKHTELDKTLLEAIKDPLTHLVRNAVDHGLEVPDARTAAGKPAEGVVRLRAYHEGGQVIIEIADDGAGIDPAAIRRKAVQKGLLTHDEAAARSDREIMSVIFQPGFSTAEQVSNISGRGVGMDVVRTNIEGIGGSVDVQSTVGEGTTFKVRIPLTLAIIPALLVACGGDRYAIPQVSLLELVRLDGQQLRSAIEWIRGVPFHRLRGRLLPLMFLDQVFGSETEVSLADREAVNIVVVQSDEQQFGLVVDEISDTAEIVVKPLGRLLKNVSAFAGATIMGDGRVALILDVMGIAEHVGIAEGRSGSARPSGPADPETGSAVDADTHRLLLVGLGERRLGLLLDTVARLEEFEADALEVSSGRPVVQYRGEILPIVDLAAELRIATDRAPGEPVQVVVFSQHGVTVGLVVDGIFDIITESFRLTTRGAAPGIHGTSVIQGAVTDIVDLTAVLRRALPELPLDDVELDDRNEVAA